MINDDGVIIELFRNELVGRDVCAVYGRFYMRDPVWRRVPDADAESGPALSVSGPDGSMVPVVEERDLMTHMAKAIIEIRDRA